MKIQQILTVAAAFSAITLITTACNMEERREKREERREERKEHRDEEMMKEKEAAKPNTNTMQNNGSMTQKPKY